MSTVDQESTVLFCSQCFATENDGSGGGTAIGHYCTNCCSGGTVVRLPLHAADSIRRNASWVGKRYYPCDEDLDNMTELRKLRATMKIYPGRTAEQCSVLEGHWTVTQRFPNGRSVSSTFAARTAEEAIEASAPYLPYFSEEELSSQKP